MLFFIQLQQPPAKQWSNAKVKRLLRFSLRRTFHFSFAIVSIAEIGHNQSD